jgi:hypothetical protein
MPPNLDHRLIQPTHEALWQEDLFTTGIGWVIVARFKPGGKRVTTGIFLVDAFCLGVKFAGYDVGDPDDYRRRIRDHYTTQFSMTVTKPWCARKFVEQSVNYAQGLGFAPQTGYKKAARVFEGLCIDQCTREFIFGLNGKPFYRRGPKETEAKAKSIVRHLDRRCGSGNFDYEVMLGEASEISKFLDL